MLALLVAAPRASVAQAPVPTPQSVVAWTAHYAVTGDLQPRLEITGALVGGWHVYAFHQADNGPIPLRVTVTDNPIATAAGAATAPEPLRAFDRGFGFETSYFAERVVISVPLRLSVAAVPEGAVIPVAVRFQACSEGLCLPPTTVRLSATPLAAGSAP